MITRMDDLDKAERNLVVATRLIMATCVLLLIAIALVVLG